MQFSDIQDYIVSTEKVAHVTFYLVKETKQYDPNLSAEYLVYSESEKRGLEQSSLMYDSVSYEEALEILKLEIGHLEAILEEKRKGKPTSKQVYFLFIHEIPIPLTLTWGEASDLIDEKLKHLTQEKAEKFNGYVVGQRVTHQFSYPMCSKSGTITKLTCNNRGGKYMHVKYDDGTSCRWFLSGTPTKTGAYHAGEQVNHSIFGKGEVLKSEMEGKTEFVTVQFQEKYGSKRLCMDFARLDKVAP